MTSEFKMNKAIDPIKHKITELAKLLIKTAKNEEELTERVIILLTQKQELESENAELIEALKGFCNRVENGEVRSVNTYKKFLDLIKKYKSE